MKPGAPGRHWIGAASACLALAAASPALANQSSSLDDLTKLSIEELANVQITSVSKRPERLAQAPAAVYVITGEDIHRSAAVNLPEALRLAPNLSVLRVDANDYAVSARGFNGYETSNKLLVLVDGRSIYSPFHSGVLWDDNQVMLDDLERIEVVSGPGGTLWGANAVNGVINVISKNAADTQGLLVRMQGGALDKDGAVRIGGRAGEAGYWRVYAMGFDRGDTLLPSGAEAGDGWQGGQTGFRTDIDMDAGHVTVQGDAYYGRTDDNGRLNGGNLLARWTHTLAGGSSLAVQAYYDRADRYVPGAASIDEAVKTWDVQAQHTLPLGRHLVVWGGGYRIIEDEFLIGQILDPATGLPLPYLAVLPSTRRLELANLFVQDEVRLSPDLTLTLGLKAEDSSYSGLEYMPNARLAWTPGENALVWAAVSRAVRTPSRVERDLVWSGIIAGGFFQNESVVAYEAGYRTQMFGRASLSISAFFNRYDDLRTNEFDAGGGFPVHVGNGREGDTWGLEAWGGYDVTEGWRLSAGVSQLRKDFRSKDGVLDIANPVSTGNDPEYQVTLRSQSDIGDRVDLDLIVRAVDELPRPAVDSYVELDARVGVKLTDEAEFFLAGTNLLDDQRREGGDPDFVNEVRRSVYAGLRWRF